MLHAPIAYDPSWTKLFKTLRDELQRATGLSAIFHIGSTAVPGLTAKPIIDIQLGVPALAAFNTGSLKRAGFDFAPEVSCDDIPAGYPERPENWRKLYARRYSDKVRISHLHIRQLDLPNFRLALLVRDFLRTNPVAASHYGTFKSRIAQVSKDKSNAGGSGTYLDLKDPFVGLLIQLAENWATQTQWRVPES